MRKESRSILIICAHQQIGNTLIKIIKDRSLGRPQLVTEAGAALVYLENYPCDMVLLGSGIKNESELGEQITKLYPHIKLIWHYGGGSGLIHAELDDLSVHS